MTPLIQLADLFTGAVSRRLNQPGNKHKDEFSDHVLASLCVILEPGRAESAAALGDMAVVDFLG